MRLAKLFAAALIFPGPVHAETPLEQGFAGALRGCEEWVLHPKSWANGFAPFVSAVGLGDKMGLIKEVNDAALPPQALRVANHYWRINSTVGAGLILVVSDKIPMCHITGGGNSDMQPAAEAVLGASNFTSRWEKIDERTTGDMITTTFRNRELPTFSILVSRATTAGQRLDRVQVLATAILRPK